MTRTLRWCGHLLAWAVIFGVLAAVTVAVLVPRVAGATPYTVLTGSMRPGLPPGTLVVVRPVPIRQVAIGDVITYQLTSGEPEVVTHRVVGQGATLGGETVVFTQGDANQVRDTAAVREVQLKGRLLYAVPVLGRLNTQLAHRDQQLATTVAAGALFAYAAWKLLLAGRVRRTEGRQP